MSALEPGLYRWQYGGKSYDGILDSDGDFSYLGSDGRHCTRGYGVYVAAPLIVIAAPEDARDNHFPRLVAFLRNGGWDLTADQIEAQTKPARIPEPGLWGVVEASSIYVNDRLTYVHHNKPGPWAWATQSRGSCKWDDLIDPTLIREGLS